MVKQTCSLARRTDILSKQESRYYLMLFGCQIPYVKHNVTSYRPSPPPSLPHGMAAKLSGPIRAKARGLCNKCAGAFTKLKLGTLPAHTYLQ